MRNRPDRHERVRAQLPTLVTEELPSWRRKLVERHVAKCDGCADELARQREVAARLARLRATAEEAVATAAVPDDLLGSLLEKAGDPGLRARAAIPARGAISGARPELTTALVLVMVALVATAAWAGWRLGRTISSRR